MLWLFLAAHSLLSLALISPVGHNWWCILDKLRVFFFIVVPVLNFWLLCKIDVCVIFVILEIYVVEKI